MESSYYHLFWGYTAFFLVIHLMVLLMVRSVKQTALRLSKIGSNENQIN